MNDGDRSHWLAHHVHGILRFLASRSTPIALTAWKGSTLFDVAFEPRGAKPEQLRAALHRVVQELYTDAAVADRRARFREVRRRVGR